MKIKTPKERYYDICFDWHCRDEREFKPSLFQRVDDALRRNRTRGDVTEAEFRELAFEIKGMKPDDSKWPNQTTVAERFDVSKTTIRRWIEAGKLRSNQKEGHDCRIDPASIIDLCEREGRTYNET